MAYIELVVPAAEAGLSGRELILNDKSRGILFFYL